MTNYLPKFNPAEVSFKKTAVTKSGYVYEENKEFYIEGNDVAVSSDMQESLFISANISNEKLNGLSKTEKEKHLSARKLVFLLNTMANYSPTLISAVQLKINHEMVYGTSIQPKKLSDSLSRLLELGLIEKCCFRYVGLEEPSNVLYKLSNVGADLVMKHEKKYISLEQGRKYPAFTAETLPPAWKAQENFLICQTAFEMMKNRFVESVYFESKYDCETETPKINSFVTVSTKAKIDRKIYLFAPRSQPGWEEYLATALKEFASRFENANEVPKLLLICENAEKLYLVHYLADKLNLTVDIIYTEDIAPMKNFETAFSWFNGEDVELQLEIK